MRHAGFLDGMFLLQAGVPYELAFGARRALSPARRLAMTVYAGQAKGLAWNWAKLSWDKPKT